MTGPEGTWRRVGRFALRLPRYALIGLLMGYQAIFSPMAGPCCRYYPSCSAYGIAALKIHGLIVGVVLTVWRLARCNPWSKGGVDHVPPRGQVLASMRRDLRLLTSRGHKAEA